MGEGGGHLCQGGGDRGAKSRRLGFLRSKSGQNLNPKLMHNNICVEVDLKTDIKYMPLTTSNNTNSIHPIADKARSLSPEQGRRNSYGTTHEEATTHYVLPSCNK